MIRVFTRCSPDPVVHDGAPKKLDLDGAVWVDLIHPSRDEELTVERALGFAVPTEAEMAQIAASSRLYRQGGATFVTVDLPYTDDDKRLTSSPATFVVSDGPLVTIRYFNPRIIRLFEENASREPLLCQAPIDTLMGLFEAVIERTAELLETGSAEVENISTDVFNQPGKTNFSRALQRLGRAQHANARITDTLASLGRALTYLSLDERFEADRPALDHVRSLSRDVASLTTHTASVAQSVDFQLSAALGLINIEQSGIIKIFSVAAVAFMPPTLIASIYGMNFEHMPELDQTWGYPVVIGAMVISALLPLWFFKKRGWL